jgi:putative redox protein
MDVSKVTSNEQEIEIKKITFRSKEPKSNFDHSFRIEGALCTPLNIKGSVPAVLILHGIPYYAKRVEDKGYLTLSKMFCNNGFLSLIFNFRGTKGSEGIFSFKNWTEDLFSAISFLKSQKKVDEKRIFVVGFSAGAMISNYCSSLDTRLKKTVLCSCSSGLSSPSVHSINRLLTYAKKEKTLRGINRTDFIKKWLMEFEQYRPLKFISKISPRPVLIVHGKNDNIVPVCNAYELFEKAKPPKDVLLVDNGHHLRKNKEAIQYIIRWLKKDK